MVQITSGFLALVFAIPMLVSAVPFEHANEIRDVPSGTSHVAFDESKGGLVAFDASGNKIGAFAIPQGNSTSLSKRGTGDCTKLSIDDAKKLKGWPALEAQAKKNWGSGKWNIVLNPKEYVGQPATVCISSDTAMVKMSGKPQCSTQKQSTGGQLVGSSGSVALAQTQGTHMTQHTSVTQESSIGAGMSISAKVGVPDVAEETTTLTTDVRITNSLTKSYDSTADTMQTSTVTQTAPEGSNCRLDFDTKSCSFSGSGNIRYTATGWVWFNYDSKTKGHYKWALNIDETLKNIDDRSSTMNFAASGNIVTKSKYKGVCDKSKAKASKSKAKKQ